jgi:DNA-binding MarR family transcriptional regulator
MAGLVYDFLTGGDRMKDEENINNQVGFEIHRTAHMMSRRLEGNVKDRGIDEVTLTHGWIIRFLYENRDKDIYQKDIEKYFLVGRSTVAGSIKLMEKKGLVRREFVECDARLKKVLLTEKGIHAHETIEAMIEELNSGLLEGIGQKETEIFLKVIRKIKENIENQRNEEKL